MTTAARHVVLALLAVAAMGLFLVRFGRFTGTNAASAQIAESDWQLIRTYRGTLDPSAGAVDVAVYSAFIKPRAGMVMDSDFVLQNRIVVTGAAGSVEFVWPDQEYAARQCEIEDLDGDGVKEFVLIAGEHGARVVSFRDRRFLFRNEGPVRDEVLSGGPGLRMVDVDGNGRREFVTMDTVRVVSTSPAAEYMLEPVVVEWTLATGFRASSLPLPSDIVTVQPALPSPPAPQPACFIASGPMISNTTERREIARGAWMFCLAGRAGKLLNFAEPIELYGVQLTQAGELQFRSARSQRYHYAFSGPTRDGRLTGAFDVKLADKVVYSHRIDGVAIQPSPAGATFVGRWSSAPTNAEEPRYGLDLELVNTLNGYQGLLRFHAGWHRGEWAGKPYFVSNVDQADGVTTFAIEHLGAKRTYRLEPAQPDGSRILRNEFGESYGRLSKRPSFLTTLDSKE